MLDDFYFSKDYISLYLQKEDKILEFEYQEGNDFFVNRTIKRIIQTVGKLDIKEKLYDLETAYGYGGYRTNSDDPEFISRAMKRYTEYCVSDKIVAEFSRFHPFNTFASKFDDAFDFITPDRNTVCVDLSLTKEERWRQYDANTRNILRKCERQLQFEETIDLDSFFELYNETMKRNQADSFYFFDKFYFQKLLSYDKCKLYRVLLEGQTISISFVLFDKEIAHYHLSASSNRFLKYNGNYFLLDCLFDIARERGNKYFHLGGGRTNLEKDTLLLFKRKFSKNTLPFYIAGKIFMKEEYTKLCRLWSKQTHKEVNYFLKYRLPI